MKTATIRERFYQPSLILSLNYRFIARSLNHVYHTAQTQGGVIMTYQGRKCRELTRLMKKKSVIDEEALTKFHRRGTGVTGKRSRYIKRHTVRVLDGLRRNESESLRKEAETLIECAKIYGPYCPDEAKKLTDYAEYLLTAAEWAEKNYTGSYSTALSEYESHFGNARVRKPYDDEDVTTNPKIQFLTLSVRGVKNFMAGISYEVNPLDTLKMISASSVFGEPQYYRAGESSEASILDGTYGIDRAFTEYSLRVIDNFSGMNTSQVMEKAIDYALTADFGGVLDWAAELRERYLMRLNPQIIMVRAASHPGRGSFTAKNPGRFSEVAQRVMSRGDDVINQIQYWLFTRGSKRGIPAILKRSWAKNIGSMSAYSMSKYGRAGIGLVDAVRISHAKGPLVDTLMREGRVPMPEGSDIWERLRSSGKSWSEILSAIKIPHMALLRNLRGIFSEISGEKIVDDVLGNLKAGVRNGRQFPFRYLSAWKAVNESDVFCKSRILSALEECMNISCENLPKLPGRSAFLTDNSGSAWNECTSEYGTMRIAEIGNLSSVIGAVNSDEGVIFAFGDNLVTLKLGSSSILKSTEILNGFSKNCGYSTENGVWLFFKKAILEHQHWDNIFIYSDMQVGHGELYGRDPEDYKALGCCINRGYPYIDVNRLIEIYRAKVNPKVNVYCIQTAGYTNVLVPEYGYRTAILYGWTGKELIFADAVRRIWDEIEMREPERE